MNGLTENLNQITDEQLAELAVEFFNRNFDKHPFDPVNRSNDAKLLPVLERAYVLTNRCISCGRPAEFCEEPHPAGEKAILCEDCYIRKFIDPNHGVSPW